MILHSIVRPSLIGYSLLLLVSMGFAYGQGRLGEMFLFPGWLQTVINTVIGVLLAVSVSLVSSAMYGAFRWAKELEEEFRLLLYPLESREVVLLAVTSGIAEELFFRGIMQPVFGLYVTSLAFGLLHYPMNRRMVPWTVIAIILGFLLGVVYQATESLLVVILAHGLINYFELRKIAKGVALNAEL